MPRATVRSVSVPSRRRLVAAAELVAVCAVVASVLLAPTSAAALAPPGGRTTVHVPYGAAPLLDGALDADEYSDAVRVSHPSGSVIYYKQDGEYLYAAVSSTQPTLSDLFQLRIDPALDGSPAFEADDWYIETDPWAAAPAFEYRPNGMGWWWIVATPTPGWSAKTDYETSVRFDAEFKVPFSMLGVSRGVRSTVGAIFSCNGGGYWPGGSSPDDENTFALLESDWEKIDNSDVAGAQVSATPLCVTLAPSGSPGSTAIYAVPRLQGQMLYALMDDQPGLQLVLYAPGIGTIHGATPLQVGELGDAQSKWITHVADYDGMYYLALSNTSAVPLTAILCWYKPWARALLDTVFPSTLTCRPGAVAGPTMRLVDYWNNPEAGHLVNVYVGPDHASAKLAATLVTDANGYVSYKTAVWTKTLFRFEAVAEGDHWACHNGAWVVPDGTGAASITIKTNATTTSIGKTPILSGSITPNGIVGKVIVVYVKKPGKSYWTYSSNRVAYSLYGNAAWQYKYYFKPGMAKGTYTFKAAIPTYPGYAAATSPTTVSIRVR